MEKLLEAIAASNTEQKILLLPQFIEHGELGISYLIEYLEDSELEIRARAYKLLQDAESDKAKKAIANGLLLNSGDRIYSIYEAGKWFTDQTYIYFNHIDYLKELRQIINESDPSEEDSFYENQRIYCHTNKKVAEQEAESLHRQYMQKICLAIDDFDWEQENPDFRIEQWCIENDVTYDRNWNNLYTSQLKWEIEKIARSSKRYDLMDKFYRDRYISIEIWCKNNHIDFKRSPDTFQNYRNLLKYLDLPENIKLLSKFYKDGVAHFSFMREEILQKKAYVKIAESLIDKNNQNLSNKLIAKPDNYAHEATNYLIIILNNTDFESKKRFKAYELLKEFDTPEAKKAIARGIDDIEVDSIFDLGDEIELNAIRNSWDGNPT